MVEIIEMAQKGKVRSGKQRLGTNSQKEESLR